MLVTSVKAVKVCSTVARRVIMICCVTASGLWMEVRVQYHAPVALPPSKSPWYLFNMRLGGPQSQFNRFWWRKNSCSCRKTDRDFSFVHSTSQSQRWLYAHVFIVTLWSVTYFCCSFFYYIAVSILRVPIFRGSVSSEPTRPNQDFFLFWYGIRLRCVCLCAHVFQSLFFSVLALLFVYSYVFLCDLSMYFNVP
jgi:hypothetical protein